MNIVYQSVRSIVHMISYFVYAFLGTVITKYVYAKWSTAYNKLYCLHLGFVGKQISCIFYGTGKLEDFIANM